MSGGSQALLNLGTAARANAPILHLNGVKEEIALGLRPMRPAYGIKLGHAIAGITGGGSQRPTAVSRARRWCHVRLWHLADIAMDIAFVRL